MKKVYLSLGSNIGKRERNLQNAIDLLDSANLRVIRISPVYETEPMERRDQPWFLNLVVEAETGLFPLQLLQRIQRIEMELGRKRLVAKGPRSIDIDILLYGSFVIRSARLEVPHPRLAQRRFVLEPLAELAPELRHPQSRRTIRELLAAVSGQTVRKVSFQPRMSANLHGHNL